LFGKLLFSYGLGSGNAEILKYCWKSVLTKKKKLIYSFILNVPQNSPLPAWLFTAGKMRDFWGQMCFHYTIIMPLKILIALAVFFCVAGPGVSY